MTIRNVSNGHQGRIPMRQKNFRMGNRCVLGIIEGEVGKREHRSRSTAPMDAPMNNNRNAIDSARIRETSVNNFDKAEIVGGLKHGRGNLIGKL